MKARIIRLSLLSAILGLSLSAHAQEKTLYIGMNGGDMQTGYTQNVFPTFEKENHVKIVVVPGTSTDILAKTQAAKDNPQMNLIFLDDGVMYRAINMKLCEPLKDKSALNNLYPTAIIKDGMATGVSIGMTGLAYNSKIFADKKWGAPTSWQDLTDPKYKNQVVFQSMPSSSYGLHAMLMLNRAWGGNDKNVEPFFDKFADTVGKNVVAYIPNSSKISEMTQTGEAALFPLTPTSVAQLKAKGLPVAYADPKEGSVVLMVAQCAIANNKEPELTQKLMAYLLSKEAQLAALKGMNYFPANKTVASDGAVKNLLADFNSYMKHAVVVDWDDINKERPKWNRQWNSEIEK